MSATELQIPGIFNLPYLHEYWKRALDPSSSSQPAGEDLDFALLAGLGLGIRETLHYLHAVRPSFEAFEAWIAERHSGRDEAALVRLRTALLTDGKGPGAEIRGLDDAEGLTEAELRHWHEQGYVIVKQAVTPEQARAAEMAIYRYLQADPLDPASWYANPQGHSIWVDLLRDPAFHATRHAPRLVKAFAQLWGRKDLWVSIDQGGFNPPERPGWPFPGPHLHWDTTLAAPHYFGVQAILYLADTDEDQGAFSCVPGFHRQLKSWLRGLPAGVHARDEALRTLTLKPIAAKAGDLVIWHHLLPHASSPNYSNKARVAQYITLKPTRWEHHADWL